MPSPQGKAESSPSPWMRAPTSAGSPMSSSFSVRQPLRLVCACVIGVASVQLCLELLPRRLWILLPGNPEGLPQAEDLLNGFICTWVSFSFPFSSLFPSPATHPNPSRWGDTRRNKVKRKEAAFIGPSPQLGGNLDLINTPVRDQHGGVSPPCPPAGTGRGRACWETKLCYWEQMGGGREERELAQGLGWWVGRWRTGRLSPDPLGVPLQEGPGPGGPSQDTAEGDKSRRHI